MYTWERVPSSLKGTNKTENVENNDNIGGPSLPSPTVTSSPKRSKKIKVDGDLSSSRDRTRSKSRTRTPSKQ